jgi:N-acyl-D-aspartate/D-glutamate deacylase
MFSMRAILVVPLLVGMVAQQAAAEADVLLQDGTIIDGSGGAPFKGNVIIRDGRITAVGDVISIGAVGRTVDCTGLVICPGFIDLHNHSDNTIL